MWFDEPLPQIQARLSRWVQKGKLIRLKKGKYVLPELYRKNTISPYAISNELVGPSYVSLETALEYYGMIPERVVSIQGITPRQTNAWQNEFGHFSYHHIKQERFFGYDKVQLSDDESFLCATPEKALIDLFYFGKGEWNKARIIEMRFQNTGKINVKTLQKLGMKMNSKKVSNAIQVFSKIRSEL